MKPTIPFKGGDEVEVFGSWKRFIKNLNVNIRRGAKRSYNKRLRKFLSRQARSEA